MLVYRIYANKHDGNGMQYMGEHTDERTAIAHVFSLQGIGWYAEMREGRVW